MTAEQIKLTEERTGPVDAPWQVDQFESTNGVQLSVSHIYTEDGKDLKTDDVCDICMDYKGTRSLDTANLIAAAPELLGGLKDAVTALYEDIEDLIEDVQESDYWLIRKLESIIAKAEGKTV